MEDLKVGQKVKVDGSLFIIKKIVKTRSVFKPEMDATRFYFENDFFLEYTETSMHFYKIDLVESSIKEVLVDDFSINP